MKNVRMLILKRYVTDIAINVLASNNVLGSFVDNMKMSARVTKQWIRYTIGPYQGTKLAPSFVQAAFNWSYTPQGHDNWENVNASVKDKIRERKEKAEKIIGHSLTIL